MTSQPEEKGLFAAMNSAVGRAIITLMLGAGDFYAERAKGIDADYNFIAEFFGASCAQDDGRDPSALMEAFLTPSDTPEEQQARDFLSEGMRVICAYALLAMESVEGGDPDGAWQNIAEGKFWLGMLAGLSIREGGAQWAAMREKLLSARHRENHEIRSEADKWLDSNFEALKLTVDDAAEKLGSIVPVKLSTRLGYVKKWKKARQSPLK